VTGRGWGAVRVGRRAKILVAISDHVGLIYKRGRGISCVTMAVAEREKPSNPWSQRLFADHRGRLCRRFLSCGAASAARRDVGGCWRRRCYAAGCCGSCRASGGDPPQIRVHLSLGLHGGQQSVVKEHAVPRSSAGERSSTSTRAPRTAHGTHAAFEDAARIRRGARCPDHTAGPRAHRGGCSDEAFSIRQPRNCRAAPSVGSCVSRPWRLLLTLVQRGSRSLPHLRSGCPPQDWRKKYVAQGCWGHCRRRCHGGARVESMMSNDEKIRAANRRNRPASGSWRTMRGHWECA